MGFRKNYTEEDFIKACAQSFSIAEVCRKLGLIPVGGNYYTIHRKVVLYEIDTSHWTGQSWSKGKILKVDVQSYATNTKKKQFLIIKNGRLCQNCNQNEWLGHPITLELHHVDGNRFNDNETNLQLLCPNCHAQTSTYRNNKRK